MNLKGGCQMKLSILTVGTCSAAATCLGEMKVVGDRLSYNTRKLFCAVDGWASGRPATSDVELYDSLHLLGENAMNLAFFYTTAEFVILCGLVLALQEVDSGHAVLWLRHSKNGWCGLFPEQDTLCAAVIPNSDSHEFPLTMLRGEERHISAGSSFLLTPGKKMKTYLRWCIDKMMHTFHQGFNSHLAGEMLQIEHLQRRFATEWAEYAPLFGCALCPLPALAGDERSFALNSRFEMFDDGTPIPSVVRDFYGKNYRLRQACAGNPFAHRTLFTDISGVTGDVHPVPLTAVPEALYQRRDDLKRAFPNRFGSGREAFVRWFLDYGAKEQSLPVAYTEPVRAQLDMWKAIVDSAAIDRRTFCQKVVSKLRRVMGITPRQTPASQASVMPQGVNLCGFIKGDFGLGEATRILADTLQASGIPFTIIDFEGATAHTYNDTTWDAFISNEFRYNVNLMLTNADGLPLFYQSVSPDAFRGRYNIGFWYWELPEFPPEWSGSFALVDEVWTSSEFTRDSIASATEKPVTVIPCSIKEVAREGMTRADFGLPENKFLFLMMYDARSFSARKNPEDAVKAFLEAFPEDDGRTALIIKVNAPRGWDGEDKLLESLRERKNIIFLIGTFPREEVNSLLCLCDAFLSLHRSEGFGLGPAEAMFWGKPAILTDWSGNQVYMRPNNCCPVPCKIIEIDRDFGPYKKGGHWAQPDVKKAAEIMRRLVDEPGYYSAIANAGQRTIREEFSPEAIGLLVRERLENLDLLQRKSET